MDQSKFNEKNTANEVLAIDLFCGCGGVTEGLKQAGFTVIAAVDNDPICCQTYRLNHPEVSLLEKDICKTSARSLKSILGKRKLDLLVVCAPCQPFSSLNKSKKPDERVYLILQSVRFTKALKPKYVLFENVPGITKNSTVINQLKSEFSKLGYNLSEPKQIDAADYGVPQRRVRCVIVASRKKMVDLPSPTTPTGHRITVRDAIGDLPAAGFINPKDSLHVCRKHSKITVLLAILRLFATDQLDKLYTCCRLLKMDNGFAPSRPQNHRPLSCQRKRGANRIAPRFPCQPRQQV